MTLAASAGVVAQAASPWDVHLHPEVVGLIAALSIGYVYALRRYGELFHPHGEEPAATPKQKWLFAGGVLSIFFALGWPLHDLGDNYLFSAHMAQHLVLGFITPPLLLLGTPEWMARLVLRGTVGRLYKWLARPIPAAIAFNVLLAFVHWPKIVDLMVSHELFHAATHLAFIAAAVLMWSVLYSPLPEVVTLTPPGRMLYLFVQTILPTVPASFLTFGDRALYRVYETFPRMWNLSAVDDMQLAGLLMKVGGGLLLWSILAVQFFRWASSEGATSGSGRSGGGGGSDRRPDPDAPSRHPQPSTSQGTLP